MKNLKLKLIAGFLTFSLLLTSCQNEAADTPKESESPSITEESSSVSIKALEQHDEAWWWENYIKYIAFDLQSPYPDTTPERNYRPELMLLISRAYQKGLTTEVENEAYDLKVPKAELEKLAPSVLGKPDISHIYTDYITDDDGYICYYTDLANRTERSEGEPEAGNWAFEVTEVEYPTPLEAVVTVVSDFKIFRYYYEQNEFDYYVLKKVTEEEKEPSNLEPLSFKTSLPYKEYANSQLDTEAKYYLVNGKTIPAAHDFSFLDLGFYLFSVFDDDDLTKPVLQFKDLIKKEEDGFVYTRTSDDTAFSYSDISIRKYSLADGKLLREVPVSDRYKATRAKFSGEYPYTYIFDDDLNFMAYSSPDGLFVDSLNGGKSFDVLPPMESDSFLGLAKNPFKIKDGKLYFTQCFSFSFDVLECFDLEKGKIEKLDSGIPNPSYFMTFDKLIGDKVVGRLIDRIDSNYVLQIYDKNTKESKFVKEIQQSSPEDIIYTEDKVFYIVNNFGNDTPSCDIFEIDLETGDIGDSVFSVNRYIDSVITFDERFIVNTGEGLIVLEV